MSLCLPEVPTLREAALTGFEYQLWAGWFAPAGTPSTVLEKISAEVKAVMSLASVREQLLTQNMVYSENTPADFDLFVRAEVDRLRDVGRRGGIKLQ